MRKLKIARHFCKSKVQESHQREVQGDGDTQAKSLDKRACAEVESTHTRINKLLPQVWQAGMRDVWNGLNQRLLKWVKWEKGLYKYASVRWLKQQY
jgi:hypothetical protein